MARNSYLTVKIPRSFTSLLFVLSALALSSCVSNENPEFDLSLTRSHPAKLSSYWQSSNYSKKSLLKKIYAANPQVLSLLRRKPLVGNVESYRPPAKAIAWMQRSIRELPHSFLKKINSKLVGIFLVSGLKDYAITEYIIGPDEQPLGAIVFLDKKALNIKANKFATLRANSVFDLPDEDYRISVLAAKKNQDSYKAGFQLIVTEQFAKVISIGATVHPPWDRNPSKQLHPLDYSFAKIGWRLNESEDDYQLAMESKFPMRNQIGLFHRSQKLDPRFAVGIYKSLEKYSFSTIAAVTSPSQDFAQSVTTYIHTRLLGRPYLVVLQESGRVVKRFSPCWTQPACSKKEKIIREMVH